MGKKKGNKDEANGDVDEVVEENATPVAKDAGKKAKKGRKKKDDDWENEVAQELENMTMEEAGEKEPELENESVPEKKEKKKEKKPKKSKTEDSDSEEEVHGKAKRGRGFAALMDVDSDDANEDDDDEPVVEEKKDRKKNKKQEKPVKRSTGFAALMDEGGDDLDDDDMDEPDMEEKKEKKKNRKQEKSVKKGTGFAALMDEGGDDLSDDDMDEPVSEEKKEKEKSKKQEKPATPAGNKNDKKKAKKGKKQKNDEEDLDQILAELEMEYKGEKPKEEPKKEEPKPVEEVPQTAEESGKKKKKQKKKEASVEPEIDDTPAEVVEKDAVKEPSKVDEAEEAKDKKVDEGTQEDASKAKKKKKKAKDAKEAAAPQPDASEEVTRTPEEQSEKATEADEDGKKKKKKGKEAEEDKKKKGKDADDDKSRKGKPSKKALAAMKEILAKQKEEEERLKREEEERLRREEEELRRIEEEKRIEQEKKDRKKQKEKERKERLKAEGKLLTPKQKAEQKRAQEMLEFLKAQGACIPEAGERRPRPGTRIRPKKPKKDEKSEEQADEESTNLDEAQKMEEKVEETPMEVDAPAGEEVKEEEEEEEVKDAWDESSDEDDEDEDTSEATKTSQETETKKTNKKADEEDDAEDESDDDEEDEEEEESEIEEMSEEHMKEAEKRRQRAVDRVAKRKEENLKKLDPDTLRAPVVCVLGHVDHGKTKILDKLRRTNVQEGEVGGITQQIGATNVPADAVKRQTHMVKDFDMGSLKFPGLLIIDTPGHESFRNLRSRGSSLCDIAILVVDITQGLEPQTRESINLLRQRGTPFVVALNKVDRIYEWDSHPSKDIREIINLQSEPSKNDFERRTSHIIQGLREEKLNSALFWENPNPKEYISLVPTSAISGDGMGNLIALICNLCQHRLKKTLMFSEELQCTVLEVKTIQGHGTTIDVILVNGRLREGDTILVAGTEGPIVTQIRSLLLPKPLKEIRVKGQYDEFKEVAAAQGVKIAARDLEKAIAGLSLKVAYHEDEIDIIREEVDKEFKSAMRSIKVKDRGVYVQASTLGALEALLEFFKTNSVPYSGIRVGPVVKRDVMRAAAMLEHDPMYAVILAFDVKVEKDAQELADKEGVKIFSEETIYHLGDRYVDYLKDYKKKKQDEFRSIAVFPSRLKIIPTAIFNKRDPIVLGVTVDAGVLRTGTPLCVPSKEFVEIGIVTSMEFDHKSVDIAKKGVDVCIKIEPVPGHTPKLFGRHFEAEDLLVSKISRESINACKDHFRDDLSKTDWKLMADLKKQFQIL